MKIDKGYIVGKGNDFFGLDYESILNDFFHSNENILENKFSIIYSLDRVDNVKILSHDTFFNQNIEKEKIVKNNANLAQIWFQSQIENDTFGLKELNKLVKYCDEKLKNFYTEKVFTGLPNFQISIYNEDCFIKNHKDGYDSMDNRICVLLLYLNKDWEIGMGGELVITDKDNNKIIVEPKFGNFALLDFTNANLEHEVKKITSKSFFRKALISFVMK